MPGIDLAGNAGGALPWISVSMTGITIPMINYSKIGDRRVSVNVMRTTWLIAFLLVGARVWAFPEGHGRKEPIPVPQIEKIRQDNYDNLNRLSKGMSREQVAAVMGEQKEIQTYYYYWKAEILSNPHRIETLQGKDRLQHEVHYYFAYLKKNDRKITTDELCPVIYRDGFLEGWGWEYYQKAIGPPPSEP
jgi:hypothetical protein